MANEHFIFQFVIFESLLLTDNELRLAKPGAQTETLGS